MTPNDAKKAAKEAKIAAKIAGKQRNRQETELAKLDRVKTRTVPRVGLRSVAETTDAIRAQSQRPDDTEPGRWLNGSGPRCLAVANGLLDLDTFALHPHSPDFFGVACVPVVFDPSAPQPEKFLAVLATLLEGGTDRIAIMQEAFGACLDPALRIKFFVALVGNGDAGKSVILTVLTAMLGAANVSAVGLERLTSERFAAFEMFGKLANICGDQTRFDSEDEGRLKTLTGGDRVGYERKGKDPFTALNTAKLIFACNAIPTFKDKTDALWNRLIAIPFNYTVPADRKDPTLLNPAAWTGELSGLLNWSIEGLKRLRDRRAFTHSPLCEAVKARHREDSDPVRYFFAEHLTADATGFIANSKMQTVYDGYTQWCDRNGYKHKLTRHAFGKSIPLVFPNAQSESRKVDGNSVRGWKGIALLPSPPVPG